MTRDPWEILELPRNSTKEQIKARYKELIKKYHPDKHKDNPLSELAEEKFKEIQQAYETLVKSEESSSYRSSRNSGTNSSYSDSTLIAQARGFISNGRLSEADQILEGILNRNDEWYFLKSVIFANQGYVQQAYSYINEALRQNPNKHEYIQFKTQLDSYATNAPYGYSQSSMMDNSLCQCLSCLCCAQCCSGGCS